MLWEPEPVKMHADEAFAEETRSASGPSNQGIERREAVEWIKDQLADGPIPSNKMIVDAKENGYSERTLRRAFKEMGGRSRKEGDKWVWCLPNQDGQEDGQLPLS